jgi:hypothetical protein
MLAVSILRWQSGRRKWSECLQEVKRTQETQESRSALVKDRTTLLVSSGSLCKQASRVCLREPAERLAFVGVMPLCRRPPSAKSESCFSTTQLGDTIISSCTIDLLLQGRKCKLCRNRHHREIKPSMSYCVLHSVMTSTQSYYVMIATTA